MCVARQSELMVRTGDLLDDSMLSLLMGRVLFVSDLLTIHLHPPCWTEFPLVSSEASGLALHSAAHVNGEAAFNC